MTRRIVSTLTFAIVLTVISGHELQAQDGSIPRGVLARSGDLFISEREFVERFEMLPALQRSRASRIEESKLDLLVSIIAERLLAQEARQRGLDQDSSFRSAFQEVRKVLARDELYRREISNAVQISEKEIAEGMAQALKEVLISFVYVEREADAEFLRKQMRTGEDFERIAIDSSFRAVRDTATVIWGDADAEIERAAYRLKNHDLSPVVAAGSGYYILRIKGARRNSYFASLAPSVLRELVERKLRERKESVRLNEFTAEVLRGKTGFARPQPLRLLADAMEKSYATRKISGPASLSETMVAEILQRCETVADDTLAVAEKVVWSVRDIVMRLRNTGFNLDSTGVRSVHRRLNNQLRIWVQQELLEQEALARRLDQSPAVARQLETWFQSMLAQYMKEHVRRQVSVTNAEVATVQRLTDSAFSIPTVRIRELRTSSLDDMEQALRQLDRGEPLEAVSVRWSGDSVLRAQRGMSDPFQISERPPLGELAWQMRPGERLGPLHIGNEYVYFELISKDSSSNRAGVQQAEAFEAVRKEARRQKEKRVLDLFLAKSAETRGFAIYQDRLLNLKVSWTPMMTFRILGFGGRMFAVPFVDPQTDWMNVEPPAGQIVF